MKGLSLHHASVITRDLEKSTAFYTGVLGLAILQRPSFSTQGTWFAAGALQVHVVVNDSGTFRGNRPIDTGDVHFALRVDDFGGVMRQLAALGYRENIDPGDPKCIVTRIGGPAGFDQVYLVDPDWNIIEINSAA